MSTRYKLVIAYDGTHYLGFQIQAKGRTVQGTYERVLSRMAKGQKIRVRGSGRTDSGVHALGQVIHFDFPFRLDEEAMVKALNTQLPDDTVVSSAEIVPSAFHAQYSAVEKTYIYRIHNSRIRDPFRRHGVLWHPYPLSIESMEEGLSYIVGEHDFTSFASTKDDKENKVRTVYEASCSYDADSEEFLFVFRGNGFLYNMIRVFIGTLIEIGDGRKEPREMKRLLEVRDRNEAGPTASPTGLYLKEVRYD